jgi:hypothetical protein
MPNKDPVAKRAWELKHRAGRLARRRELRRVHRAQSAQERGNPAETGVLLLTILAGAALAAYGPKLAMGAGGLTLWATTLYRKGWVWWFIGALIILLALAFLKWDKSPETEKKK